MTHPVRSSVEKVSATTPRFDSTERNRDAYKRAFADFAGFVKLHLERGELNWGSGYQFGHSNVYRLGSEHQVIIVIMANHRRNYEMLAACKGIHARSRPIWVLGDSGLHQY